jgi:hypothetical protein
MDILIGLYYFGALIHFGIIQHKTAWYYRTNFEKFQTIFVFVFTALIIIGASAE